MAKAKALVSFALDDLEEGGGGLPTNFPAIVVNPQFVVAKFGEGGKKKQPSTYARFYYVRTGEVPEGQRVVEETHYRVSGYDEFLPSKDGAEAVDWENEEGAEAEGQMLVRVQGSSLKAPRKSTNFGHLIETTGKAGFPAEKVTGDLAEFDGAKVVLERINVKPMADGTVPTNAKGYPIQLLGWGEYSGQAKKSEITEARRVLAEFLEADGDGDDAPAPAKAAKGKSKPADDDDEDDDAPAKSSKASGGKGSADLPAKATAWVVAQLEARESGSLRTKSLATRAMEAEDEFGKDTPKVMKLMTDAAFLGAGQKAGKWKYDAEAGTVTVTRDDEDEDEDDE